MYKIECDTAVPTSAGRHGRRLAVAAVAARRVPLPPPDPPSLPPRPPARRIPPPAATGSAAAPISAARCCPSLHPAAHGQPLATQRHSREREGEREKERERGERESEWCGMGSEGGREWSEWIRVKVCYIVECSSGLWAGSDLPKRLS